MGNLALLLASPSQWTRTYRYYLLIYAGTPGTVTVPVVPTLLPVPGGQAVGRGVEMTKDGLLASSQVRSRGYGTDDDE